MTIHLIQALGNILEVTTDWVDADTHFPKLHDSSAENDWEICAYYTGYGFEIHYSEPEILSVGSVISTVNNPPLANVVEECRADIERILKKFNAETPDNGQKFSEDQAGVVRKPHIRFCLMNQTVQHEKNSV
ncbi:MAG: hypothetical protein LUD47_05210 [Clostridia bacterium]|nr:hypothetical protein [Clostridia bacterium]